MGTRLTREERLAVLCACAQVNVGAGLVVARALEVVEQAERCGLLDPGPGPDLDATCRGCGHSLRQHAVPICQAGGCRCTAFLTS